MAGIRVCLDDYLNPLEQLVGQWQRADPIRETIMETALGVLWDDLKGSTQTEIPDPYKVRTAPKMLKALASLPPVLLFNSGTWVIW